MDEKETNRLEAFSDGVFAVAITLLILNLKVPGIDLPPLGGLQTDKQLWATLSEEWPAWATYATSFLTIGVMWLNHHRLFTHIKRIDTVLIFINLFLLMIIVSIPFPTALLAEYIGRPDLHVAAILYSGVCFLMACLFNILWRYASYHHRLLGNNVDEQAVEAISRQYLFGPLVYLIVFAIAWFSSPVSVALIFLLVCFFALPSRAASSLASRKTGRNVYSSKSSETEEMEM